MFNALANMISPPKMDEKQEDGTREWRQPPSDSGSDVDTDQVEKDSLYGDAIRDEKNPKQKAYYKEQAKRKIKGSLAGSPPLLGLKKGRRSSHLPTEEDSTNRELEDELEDIQHTLTQRLPTTSITPTTPTIPILTTTTVSTTTIATAAMTTTTSTPVPTTKSVTFSTSTHVDPVNTLAFTFPTSTRSTTKVPTSTEASTTVVTATSTRTTTSGAAGVDKQKWPFTSENKLASGGAIPKNKTPEAQDPLITWLKKSYGTCKAKITTLRNELNKCQGNRGQLLVLDRKFQDALKNLQDGRGALMSLDYLPYSDYKKVDEDFLVYEKNVTDARHEITNSLDAMVTADVLRQGARKKGGSDPEKKTRHSARDGYFERPHLDLRNHSPTASEVARRNHAMRLARQEEAEAYRRQEAQIILTNQRQETPNRKPPTGTQDARLNSARATVWPDPGKSTPHPNQHTQFGPLNGPPQSLYHTPPPSTSINPTISAPYNPYTSDTPLQTMYPPNPDVSNQYTVPPFPGSSDQTTHRRTAPFEAYNPPTQHNARNPSTPHVTEEHFPDQIRGTDRGIHLTPEQFQEWLQMQYVHNRPFADLEERSHPGTPTGMYASRPRTTPTSTGMATGAGTATHIGTRPNPELRFAPPGQTNWQPHDFREKAERPLTKIEAFPFDGTPATEPWTRWKQSFHALVGCRNYDDATKLYQLMRQLKGEPLKIAESLTMSEYNTRTYCVVWNALEENYGGLERLRNSIFNQIKAFPKLKKFDKENTLLLENLLIIIEEKFKDETGLIDHGGVLNAQIKDIIPHYELTQYFLELARENVEDTFQSLKKFVSVRRMAHKHADINSSATAARALHTIDEPSPSAPPEEDQAEYESHAAYVPYKKYPPKDAKPESKPITQIDGSKIPSKPSPKDSTCTLCKLGHALYMCPDFKLLAYASKIQHVKRTGACMHCLNQGHLMRECTFFPERTCGIDGCTRQHHRQLHNFTDIKTGMALLTVEEYFEQDKIYMANQSFFGRKEGEYIAIRTTTALLTSNGKTKRVVIAMDPCSNSTNIDETFAHEMGLKIDDTGVIRNINYLESRSTVESDIVSFTLSPLDKSASYELKAYTIKNLISGTPVVNWKKVSESCLHLQQAEVPEPDDDDRVHILLGTDYAFLNGASKCISGDVHEPIAELTKLGWAFSGRVKTDQILESWIAQFGAVDYRAYTTYVGYYSAPWFQQKPKLSSYEDWISRVDKVVPIQDNIGSFTPIEPKENTLTQIQSTITPADVDLACLASFDADPGLFTYLSMSPNDNTPEEKLQELDDLIRKQWEIEALGLVERVPRVSNDHREPSEKWTKSEKIAAKKMNITYLPELQQFQMSIPWKDDPPKFKSNRSKVKGRQDGVCARLGHRISDAKKIFDGYLEKGYIRKLDKHEIHEHNVFYLPFFTVVKEESTTPVRIVWDCAAKYDGKSLNSEIMQTPNCLQPLFKILMRVRKFPWVVMSDISEMFLKVRLDPKDRRYHRFTFDGEDYEWLVILFGNQSSPDGSQMVIQLNCIMHGADLPEACETVQESTYMDDGADSRETEEIALKLAQELIILFSKCGMPVHKFFSNSPLVCQTLDKKALAKQISFSDETDTVWESGKVLGMTYSVEEGDVFTFASKFRQVSDFVDVKDGKWTKRNICSASASIFDPLGLISPFVVRARVIMQEIWRLKIPWDEPLPENIQEVWMQWLDQVFVIPDIKIPRWSGMVTKSTKYQLHTFCDASTEGYCVAVFIRIKTGSHILTNLMAAKSRVSPLKAESISRQELVGCVLAVRLSAAVQETYPSSIENTFYWTDSEVCLSWINYTAKSFKAFVAHRVGEIQTHTEPRQWLHVPTAENPADVGTRAISAEELKDSELWWKGPSFLQKPINQWPKSKILREIESTELKETIFLAKEALVKVELSDSLAKLHPKGFSVGQIFNGFQKCVRKWAMLLKAVNKFKNLITEKKKKEERILDPNSKFLTPNEILIGKRFLIKQSQLEYFEDEIRLMNFSKKPLAQIAQGMKTNLMQFNPFLDEFGVMRSMSRLINLGMDYETSHPVILHRSSDLTRLVALDAHFQFSHPVGFTAMKAAIRKHYAIIGLGTLCSQINHTCPQCKKLRAKPSSQQMAPLPERRVGAQMRAFEHTGIDYAGPFDLKVGRGKVRKKVWVLVLTCMTVRAVHFEVTGGIDTYHVINAISRFVDVRGIPATITSDNQTSFVKTNEDLKMWYASIDWEKVATSTGFGFRPFTDGITWHFNPPIASHFGGIFETIVKAMKRALKAICGQADLDEEDFRTVVSKMSHLLNCRPIQLVNDVSDYETLTPNHFLLPGLADAVFPPEVSDNDKIKLPIRLRHQINTQKHVWKRFQNEVIPMLGPRTKWCQEKPNLNEDDVVMEMDDNLPRGAWRLLRVTRILPSEDGLVRKVEVINSVGKKYLRPIHRLIPIARA